MLNTQNFNGKQLGEVVGKVLKEAVAMQDAFEDPITVECGDCGPLIARHHMQRIDRIAADAGLKIDDLLEIVSERTTPKWVFQSGLGGVAHFCLA